MRKQEKGDEKVCGDLKHLRRRRWTVAWRSPPDWHAKKNKKCRKMQKMQQQENCKLENVQTKAQLDEHERITSRFTKNGSEPISWSFTSYKKDPFVDVHLQLLSLLLCDIGDQMDQLGWGVDCKVAYIGGQATPQHHQVVVRPVRSCDTRPLPFSACCLASVCSGLDVIWDHFFAGKILLRIIPSLKPQICLTRKLCKRGRNISRVQIQKCHGFSISGW